jgi:hypothetical protein
MTLHVGRHSTSQYVESQTEGSGTNQASRHQISVAKYILLQSFISIGKLLHIAQYSDGLGGWVSVPGRGKKLVCTPQYPDWLWVPPSLLSRGSFLGGKAAGT